MTGVDCYTVEDEDGSVICASADLYSAMQAVKAITSWGHGRPYPPEATVYSWYRGRIARAVEFRRRGPRDEDFFASLWEDTETIGERITGTGVAPW